MKQRLIISTLAGVLSIGLFAPHIAHAEESAPVDPPYQENVEEPTEPTPEPVTTTPVTEETSGTLPTVYTSPMTPADPTSQPTVAAQPQTEPAEVAVTPTGSSVLRVRLVTNLLTTLTPQSMRQSRIWSGF